MNRFDKLRELRNIVRGLCFGNWAREEYPPSCKSTWHNQLNYSWKPFDRHRASRKFERFVGTENYRK